ncbi:hypothetical protein [Streptomyces acidiscabies]|uniref:Uncharacterized protein n=1 Tax=Streptomyces acidiscabies TaxID=42234 RepID=A0AAP6EGW1_9ACTN|nr:hypothetical protein [Streptomyces acidiscabies]MBP5942487.1 hypothetical protein [Streptomyces sp. LBUM 1476]MBZ3917762.1 hypothetical protein [Streptomyces acidiscabies]MDX2961730.1 hypothetical protein [Streptomyces acidiscabies]MDX3023523.1 hypothetical protein [Streptomyces acidiscabies]MDX3789271.1 hypothetical protein [Streptomyces acidiscabies]
MTAPVHFQQQLAEELTARAAALQPTAAVPLRPRHTRRIAVTALGLAAAVTAVVLIPRAADTTATPQAEKGRSVTRVPDGSAPVLSNASYTVAPRKDGTVTVLVTGAEVSGLQAALRSLGVPAVVLRASESCSARVRTDNANLETVSSQDPKNGRLMVIRPSAIPRGDSLVLVQPALKGALHPDKMYSMEVMLAPGEPSCFPASQSSVGVG